MDDAEFEALKVASIVPQKERWPSPNVSVSILGPVPTVSGALYWEPLHAAVDWHRAHFGKTLTAMAAVDADKSLSAVGKASKKQEIAAAAITNLERSKSLEKARTSVERQVASWEKELNLIPEPAANSGEAMVRAEIRSHIAALKPGERLAFINDHATEVAAAMLSAPGFLSGLTPAELGVVKARIAQRTNPALAQAKADLMQAMQDVEAGHRAAVSQINARVKETKVVAPAAISAPAAPLTRKPAGEKEERREPGDHAA